MEATVIMAKCKVSKEGFGIRAQKQGSSWLITWAFQLSDNAAKNEGYNNTMVSGSLGLDSDYPGCPHCGANSFFQCGGCHKIVCYENDERVICPHCGIICEGFASGNFDGIKGGAF